MTLLLQHPMPSLLNSEIMNTPVPPLASLDFDLPSTLEAHQPPEARGLTRDSVQLMVSHYKAQCVDHAHFYDLPRFLTAGDVLVINTSATLPSALPATRADGTPLELHISTHLPANLWSVEARRINDKATQPFYDIQPGETLNLPGGGYVTFYTPYRADQRTFESPQPRRLWIASLQLPLPLHDYLTQYGFPIRYSYIDSPWPLSYYQTVYANEPGSAEMASAGRAFTAEIITKLAAQGVQIAPIVLHTGVSSLESHEPPYEEYYRVPLETARLINAARAAGQRIIAVGTTAIRALETVADANGQVHPGEGWTNLVITPQRGLRVIDGLLTGLHEPRSSHLQMLEALCRRNHLLLTYAEALHHQYLWHEFGDLHLILP
jgi:S-adenosylmethionine:tRNA ribosyltransferase-isomerase